MFKFINTSHPQSTLFPWYTCVVLALLFTGLRVPSLLATPRSVDPTNLILGVSSPTLTQPLVRRLESGLGGILLIGTTWKHTTKTRHFIQQVKKINPTVLICVDQEGGAVTRLSFPPGDLPSARHIGRSSSVYEAHRWGLLNGRHLKQLGVDVNFAPVLDVVTATGNIVIGSRSFGSNADHVAQLGIAYMTGLMDAGILPVIKHFPGHGDTIADSHHQLPINHHTMRYLEHVPIAPFYAAIQHGAPAIMLAHIRYPSKDHKYPASLSKSWISYLKKDLGFTGLIITDDLSMKAISRHYSQKTAIELARNAGVDYVIITGG
jgi:beta-N-acetylhexosaminidase